MDDWERDMRERWHEDVDSVINPIAGLQGEE